MRCILCLTVSDHVIHIFEDQSFNLDINKIIAKHFWLQPNKGDDNSNYICCSCWNILETFHNFYEKVEAAHRNLLNVTTKSVRLENDFKEEKESDADNFDGSPDYTAGIKLEVNENITSVNHLTSLDEKINTFDRFANADVTDSDSEIPLARLIKCRRSSSNKDTLQESNENDEPLSDGPFCDNYDGDSDYECNNIKLKDIFSDDCNYKPPKPIKRSKKSTKSQQKTKSENKECRAKRKTIDPVRKRELSKEFDEVIEKNLKLSCSLCHIPLANFFLLRKHYHNAHKERGYATCCGKKFRKRGVLVDHIYLHLNPEFFKCDRCERILADRRSLEVHMSTHDTSKERIYQCQECNKSFYRKLLLDRHMYTHIPDRKFNCEDCQKLFSSDYTLRQHINNVHNSAYNKICEQCGKSIRGPQAFRRHQLEHAGAAVPLVQCEKCGVKLTNKYGLKRHMDSMHPETKIVHDCKLCGKIAPSLAALQRHISYMHKCERNHKCPMCDKAFKKPSGLREHMSTHTGEVLYTCPHCPKTFNSNANMHSHRKKMHRKEWEENRRHPHMGAAPVTE